MAEAPKAKGGGGKHGRKRVSEKPTLDAQGIDKNLADRARKAAAMPEKQFEAAVAKATSIAVAAVENDKAVIAAARAERHVIEQEHRVKRSLGCRWVGIRLLATASRRL